LGLGAVAVVALLATAATANAQIAFRAAATPVGVNANSISIARPSGTLQNDVMLAAIAMRGGSNITITAPAGWNLVLRTDNGTTIGVATYWKLAGTAGADPGPYAFGFSAGIRAVGGIDSYSGVHLTTPINTSNGGTGTSASVVAPSVTTAVANTLLVAVFSSAHGNSNFTQPAGMSERWDFGDNAGPNGVTAATDDEAQAAAGASGSRTSTYGSSKAFAAQLVALAPDSCGNGTTEPGEQCDDGGTANGDCCSSTCQFESAGTVCRAAAGVCDAADTCTGASGTCPADGKLTSLCRASAGTCDAAESCDGVGNNCPADALVSAGTQCRGAAGVCVVAEACDGISVACPADWKSTAECRGAAGNCDVAESCDGVGNNCPADVLVSAGTQCRGAAGTCDIAESCNGMSAACPADAKSTAE
jgi:cysteine-rich repeat protein